MGQMRLQRDGSDEIAKRWVRRDCKEMGQMRLQITSSVH